MPSHKTGWLALLGSLLLNGASVTSALADDSEIFFGPKNSAENPNVLFILDTSGSMGFTVQQSTAAYNPDVTYVGSGICNGIVSRVFYKAGTQTVPPTCDSSEWVPASAIKCAAAKSNLALGAPGRFVDFLIRWGKVKGGKEPNNWQTNLAVQNGADVECRADNGVDGNLVAMPSYPKRFTSPLSSSSVGVWTAVATDSYWVSGTQTQFTLFSANYTIWYHQHRSGAPTTRMTVLKEAANNVLDTLQSANIGLMRYDTYGNGGMVAHEIAPIETARASLKTAINSYTPNGSTPLSETFFEAYKYLSGGTVLYGNTSNPFKSVANSRTPATSTGTSYNSPADTSCQKSYTVYLTDGEPTSDSGANAAIQALPSFATLGGTCSGPFGEEGKCLGALAQYMFNTDLRTDIPGQQNARSFFIGFGDTFSGTSNTAFSYLQDAAQRGGGEAYTANDVDSLNTAISNILSDVADDSATFTAPTVAVNAFHKVRSLNDIYLAVFRPTGTWHWPGNIKKYRVVNSVLYDARSPAQPAVDPASGGFYSATQSYWSLVPDGNQVTVGGAASMLPNPDETAANGRKVYTWLGGSNAGGTPVSLTAPAQAFKVSNAGITDTILATNATDNPLRDKLIKWARGFDVDVDNGIGNRNEMGDPLHSQPAIVIYGGTTTSHNTNDAALYVATNDGYLHAFDVLTGVELWSFLPKESLANLLPLYNDDPTTSKRYTLDGDVTVVKFDVNGDGVIDPVANAAGQDRVILYVSQGRGGSKYYALDITDKNNPKYMWGIGATELPGIGQAWSTPAIGRIRIAGAAQNSQKLVMVIGGGYDPADDAAGLPGTYLDRNSVGNRLFVIDAISGATLWSGGPAGAGTTQTFGARMSHAFPAQPEVVDTDGDGFLDRIYIGDLAAQLWRFDIWNNNSAASLMTGGVLASLGTRDQTSHPAAEARRFFNSPDTARVALPGVPPYMAIAIGSGYRAHPLNTSIHDSFYVIRDYQPYTKLSQAEYDARYVTQDADANLIDVTNVLNPVIPRDAAGWKMRMNQTTGSWVGEKILSAGSTMGGSVIFTAYTPQLNASAACEPTIGSNRSYIVSVLDGSATVDTNNNGTRELTDRYQLLRETGIAAEARILFPSQDSNGDGVDDDDVSCAPTDANCTVDGRRPAVCMIGRTVLQCPPTNTFIKTYWREGASN